MAEIIVLFSILIMLFLMFFLLVGSILLMKLLFLGLLLVVSNLALFYFHRKRKINSLMVFIKSEKNEWIDSFIKNHKYEFEIAGLYSTDLKHKYSNFYELSFYWRNKHDDGVDCRYFLLKEINKGNLIHFNVTKNLLLFAIANNIIKQNIVDAKLKFEANEKVRINELSRIRS